jgi:uncharacterized protein
MKKHEPATVIVDRALLADFCTGRHRHRLSLFGSILGDAFRPDSDIDLQVEFETGRKPGFIGLAAIERELSELLGGRKVDLRTPEELSSYFRDDVFRDAELLYEADA